MKKLTATALAGFGLLGLSGCVKQDIEVNEHMESFSVICHGENTEVLFMVEHNKVIRYYEQEHGDREEASQEWLDVFNRSIDRMGLTPYEFIADSINSDEELSNQCQVKEWKK